jgi:hypothetical protein
MSVLEKCGGEMVNEIYILCYEPCLVVFSFWKIKTQRSIWALQKVATVLDQWKPNESYPTFYLNLQQ